MSLYNSVFGKNPNSDLILKMIGLSQSIVPRFRDCTITDGEIQIVTRTGGSNRLTQEEFDDGLEPEDGTENSNLTSNKYYLRDADDSFDNTYASFYFSIPKEWNELAEKLTGKKTRCF